jgi:integrase/recombinase XerC
MLLADKRSAATKRAYAGDLRAFFGTGARDPAPEVVRAFVSLAAPELALRLNRHKGELIERGAAEATINRRLAAVRSLLKFCQRIGFAVSDGHGLVDSERVQAYRDTRGVDVATLRRLLAAPGTGNLAGLRDTALLRLLCENALRRGEVAALDVEDFEPGERRARVLGKGKGTQKVPISLSATCCAAIAAYLDAAGHQTGALFRNLDHRPGAQGGRLTGAGLYHIIQQHGRALGLPRLTPHQLRHSAITAALDATGGDVRRVQRLSRHARLETLQRYDDNREDLQGEVTGVLSGLLGAPDEGFRKLTPGKSGAGKTRRTKGGSPAA